MYQSYILCKNVAPLESAGGSIGSWLPYETTHRLFIEYDRESAKSTESSEVA